jgi:hypothetical protein
MSLVSCSKKQVAGTIVQYGYSYSIHQSLTERFKVREDCLLRLKEYPGRTFKVYKSDFKDTQMSKLLEEAEKRGDVPFDQTEYYKTPTNTVKVVLSSGPMEERWNLVSNEVEPPNAVTLVKDHSATNHAQVLKSYQDERRGFEFQYPADWQVLDANELAAKSRQMITAGPGGDIVLAVGNPDDWDQNLIFKMPGRMDADLTQEQLRLFGDQLDRSMSNTFENFKKISQSVIKVSGADALEYIMQSTQHGEVFDQKEVIFTKGGVAFILICTGKPEMFEKLDNERFQVILHSLKAR